MRSYDDWKTSPPGEDADFVRRNEQLIDDLREIGQRLETVVDEDHIYDVDGDTFVCDFRLSVSTRGDDPAGALLSKLRACVRALENFPHLQPCGVLR